MKTIPKRMTARVDDSGLVVFLIGMRVNRWWKIGQWLRTSRAMPRMLKELSQKPELGFLGAESWFGRTTIMVSYWRSMDDLMAYAKSRDAEHLPAWRAFNKLIGTNGDVGIWHETYRVRTGDYENVYVNMMPFGMGKVGALVEATGSHGSTSMRAVHAELAARAPAEPS
ncbi:MAG: DUF4188 domain-containing protein [Polyangiaceae bacterium]